MNKNQLPDASVAPRARRNRHSGDPAADLRGAVDEAAFAASVAQCRASRARSVRARTSKMSAHKNRLREISRDESMHCN
jgi:hypothetical protein